jgi:predicted RNase H-like HicB family nuclease
MRYPVAIEVGTDTTAFGVVVPDLPGCFSAGDTLDEALGAAEEAAAAWIDAALDAGLAIPKSTSLEAIPRLPEKPKTACQSPRLGFYVWHDPSRLPGQ